MKKTVTEEDMKNVENGSRFSNALVGVMFGLFIALVGVLFCWLLFRGYLRAKATRGWEEKQALVVRSEVKETEPVPNGGITFVHDFLYEYDYAGKNYQGNRIKRVESGSHLRRKIRERVDEYPIGRETTCYVDPANPTQAILEHSTLAPLYTIWFPGLFVIGGIGISAGSIFRGLNRR